MPIDYRSTVSTPDPVQDLRPTAVDSEAGADPAFGPPRPVNAWFTDPAIACLSIFLFLSAVLFAVVLHVNEGHFLYSLDDPYIHLALSDRLAHGLYGLNTGEIETPSSSILWPFLLLPGAGSAWHVYLPLIYNLLFGSLTARLMGRMARRWQWLSDGNRLLRCWAISFLLVIGANLVGLEFTGMEHSLQVLLAVACAYGVMEAYAGRRIPAWTIAATVLAPTLRYESYILCVAIAVALFAQKRRRSGVAVLALGLVAPIAFGTFLMAHGLPPLPNSVLVKGNAFVSRGGVAANLLASTTRNAMQYLVTPKRWPTTIALPLLLAVLWRERRNPLHRMVLAGVAFAVLLQMLAGSYGWFFRYEVYAKILAIMTVLAATAALRSRRFVVAAFALLAFADAPYYLALTRTPNATQNIYQQQFQMHRFAQLYGGNFAVNDLGWTSYRLPPSTFILDLMGLASTESMRQKDKNPAWLDEVTRRHGCGLAMVYPAWFTGIPRDWTPVARLSITVPRSTAGFTDVIFYETPFGTPQERNELPAKLKAFQMSLPKSVIFTPGSEIPDREAYPVADGTRPPGLQ